MELNRNSSWKYVLVGMVSLLILGSIPTHAVEYHFVEDFSNADSWTFRGTDWSAVGEVEDLVDIEPSVDITGGELVFSGELDRDKNNRAVLQDSTSRGAWSFKVYHPAGVPVHPDTGRIWAAAFSEVPYGPNANETFWGQFGINFVENVANFNAFNGSENRVAYKSFGLPNQTLDEYQEIDVVRTEHRLYVFMGGVVALNISLSSSVGQNIQYFTIMSVQGSQVRIDDLRITNDYAEKLEELVANIPDDGSGNPSEESSEGALMIGLGALTVATVSSLYGYHHLKKKRLNKLIKISSNGTYPNISNIVSELFDNQKSLYFTLLGYKTKDLEILDDKIEAAMSSQIQRYKHLLNPYRMSIMQILNIENKIKSSELKSRLDLSWTEFYNASRSLEKIGLIRTFEDFDDNGLKKQFVVITDNGKQQFVEFVSLISKYVDIAKEFIPGGSQGPLYP